MRWRVKLSPVEQELVKAFEHFQIVDAHEHLPPERIRLEMKVDVFNLFSHYTRTDLITAGMPPANWEAIHNTDLPQEERWRMFAPFLKSIRYGSYARPAFIAANEFYGFEDITEKNYRELSERIAAQNTPGIYHRILRDKCNIRVALTQAKRTDYETDILIPIMPLDTYAAVRSGEEIRERAERLGTEVRGLDDYLRLIRVGLERWVREGVVGIKMSSRPYVEPIRSQAVALCDRLMHDPQHSLPDMNPLRSFLTEAMLDMAVELDLVVAVHTGMWGDFRQLDPKLIIPAIMRHPKTRFDVYHMGMPWVRDTALIGKNFPNVWLNLCWSHIISPRMTCAALDEWIDLVPMNKIIAFGGDYGGRAVEKIFGHLVMARENIARVLGRRVEEGLMSLGEAVSVAERWFCHNPRQLYRLDL